MQFEHRLASHNSASKNIGQVSDGEENSHIQLNKEKEIKLYTKTPQEVYTNPVDPKIMELRRKGEEVPKELLEKKFSHNRES